MTFTFDGNYRNTEQVVPFMADYLDAYANLRLAGQYPYNDSFKGMPALAGRDEDTAIYLMQGLRALAVLGERVEAARCDGFVEGVATDTPVRYAEVIHYGWYMGGTGWQSWKDARLVRFHSSPFVIPKGRRTNGHLLSGCVLVKEGS